MFARYVLLISLFFTSLLHAEEISFNLTGFASTTVFEDNNWYPNASTAAINVDAFYNEWAIRGQVAVPYTQPVRRLVLEKAFWITKGQELTTQIGRFPRLDSFYNNVTDVPGTSGLAMLPLGEYNRRMISNRTFNSVDGVQAIYGIKTPIGHFKLHADYGKMVVDNQCDTQIEATKIACRPTYEIAGQEGNYDVGITYEKGPWTILLYRAELRASTNLFDHKDRISTSITKNANRISYDANKLGIKYNTNKWWVQTEYMENNFELAKISQEFKSVQRASNFYLLAGYYWTDQLSTYAIYNHGSSNTSLTGSTDRVLGVTYTVGNLTTSIEQHKGNGKSWKKYFAPEEKWNSWVASATYRF